MGAEVLEEHHIVPRRHGGSDDSDNLVDLCPTCHEKVERLYDRRFYDELGIEQDADDDPIEMGTCDRLECLADAEHLIKSWAWQEMHVCPDHKVCGYPECERRSVSVVPCSHGEVLLCDEHRTCDHQGCESKTTRVVREPSTLGEKYHEYHVYCRDPSGEGEDHIPEDTDHNTYEVFW
jgi:hypothetical protein